MENKINTQAMVQVHSTEWFNSFPVLKKKPGKSFGSETSVFYHKNHIFKEYCISRVPHLNKTNAMAYRKQVQCVLPF
jgi:hypothetical protein